MAGDIIYQATDGPRIVEVRAMWDRSGNVRAIRFFYGKQTKTYRAIHLGHNERIKFAMGIAPEVRVLVEELEDFFTAMIDTQHSEPAVSDLRQLVRNLWEASR